MRHYLVRRDGGTIRYPLTESFLRKNPVTSAWYGSYDDLPFMLVRRIIKWMENQAPRMGMDGLLHKPQLSIDFTEYTPEEISTGATVQRDRKGRVIYWMKRPGPSAPFMMLMHNPEMTNSNAVNFIMDANKTEQRIHGNSGLGVKLSLTSYFRDTSATANADIEVDNDGLPLAAPKHKMMAKFKPALIEAPPKPPEPPPTRQLRFRKRT